MSEAVILRVLEVPGPRSKAWRQAIAERCRLAGWDYLDYGGNEPPRPKAGRNTVIVGWNWDDAIEGARWCVLTAQPSQAVAAFRELHGRSESEALYHVANSLAQAADLAARGAQVWRDADPVLEVPGLGEVVAKGDAEPPEPASPGSLALYAAIPLEPDARAEWPALHFNYQGLSAATSGPMTIGLLGRRRLLFNGPNIALPSGTWTARATLVLEPHSAADVLVEWGYGHDVTPLRTILKKPGRYEVEITHDWKAPAPADFRISLMMPCLDGALTFEGLTVARSPSQKGAAAPV